MKLHRLVWISALLAGCGGGGGSSSPAPSATTPVAPVTPSTPAAPAPPDTPAVPATPVLPVVPVVTDPVPVAPVAVAPPAFTLLPATISSTYVAGYPAPVTVSAKLATSLAGTTYFALASDVAVLPTLPTLAVASDGTINVTVKPSATVLAGHYVGKVAINACSDANCATPLPGSPVMVPYDFVVDPPAGGATAVNLTGLSAWPGTADWETLQANARHDGSVPVTLNPASFSTRWNWVAPAEYGHQYQLSTITTGTGRLYFSTTSQFSLDTPPVLFALNESDGATAWSHPFVSTDAPVLNPPAVSAGKVYLTAGRSGTNSLYAFDAATGSRLFATTLGSQGEQYLAPTIYDQTVYTEGGTFGGLYALDKTSGAKVFFNLLHQYQNWSPAVDANDVYVYVGGTLATLDRSTGLTLSELYDPTVKSDRVAFSSGAPVLGAAGSVMAINFGYPINNGIVGFDTVARVVRYTVTGAYPGALAYQGGTLFAANNQPLRLEARNEKDGTLAWSWTPPAADLRFTDNVIVTNNLVFAATTTTTYAIDRTTHAVAWSYPAAGSLVLSPNGILYIQAKSRITAINVK